MVSVTNGTGVFVRSPVKNNTVRANGRLWWQGVCGRHAERCPLRWAGGRTRSYTKRKPKRCAVCCVCRGVVCRGMSCAVQAAIGGGFTLISANNIVLEDSTVSDNSANIDLNTVRSIRQGQQAPTATIASCCARTLATMPSCGCDKKCNRMYELMFALSLFLCVCVCVSVSLSVLHLLCVVAPCVYSGGQLLFCRQWRRHLWHSVWRAAGQQQTAGQRSCSKRRRGGSAAVQHHF